MGATVQAPTPRDYGTETRQTLEAQLALAPEKYAAEAKYAPLYQNLQIGLLKSAAPELMGIYKQYAPELAQAEAATRSVTRGAEIADIAKLGPQAREAMRAAAPEQTALADTLTRQAQSGLNAGSQLTPIEARQAQQSVRQAQAARGLAQGPGSVLQEAALQQQLGSTMQRQRQQQAMGALGASQGVYGDVFQQVLGRPSQSFGALGGFAGQAGGFNPGQLFNPESQYAGDIFNQNMQTQLAARTASAANVSSMVAGGLSAL
jgi:hypothetical protein